MNKETVIGALVGAALAGGGLLTVDFAQLQSAQSELETTKTAKHEVLKQYVYSQITSDRIPTIDLTYVTPEEYTQTYVDLVGTADLSQPDLFEAGKELAKQRGDYICAK